jgi:hypothetical protein
MAALHLCLTISSGMAADPVVITEPVSIAQFDDAIIVYIHGFDVARTRYPALDLEYRMIRTDGSVSDPETQDLTEPWEKPAIILRKDSTEYAGIVLAASSGSDVFFRRYYALEVRRYLNREHRTTTRLKLEGIPTPLFELKSGACLLDNISIRLLTPAKD